MEKNKDILVEEIRERANSYWGKYKYDIKKIAEAIKWNEKRNSDRIVNIYNLNKKELQSTVK